MGAEAMPRVKLGTRSAGSRQQGPPPVTIFPTAVPTPAPEGRSGMSTLLEGIDRLHSALSCIRAARDFTDVPRMLPESAEELSSMITQGHELLADLMLLARAYADRCLDP